MRLKSKSAHPLIVQFVEWNRFNRGKSLNYPTSVPFINMIQRNRRDDEKPVSLLEPWFTDDEAVLVNELLSVLKSERKFEFKVLMHYYFTYQEITFTAERFGIRNHHTVGQIIDTGLAFIDGQIATLIKERAI